VRLYGTRVYLAAPDALWAFLLTPARLRQCLPGCESFEATGPDTYGATLRLGVGFLKGTYTGSIRVAERRFPEHLELVVYGGGALGSLEAQGVVTFRDLGSERTEVTYDGEALVGGRVAMLGEGLIRATAERLFGVFLDCMASHVEGPAT
jgi:carbon monoxide dehydrogenase subunit G